MFLAWKKLKKLEARILLLKASLAALEPPRPVIARHIAKNAMTMAARVLNLSVSRSRSMSSAASSAFIVVSRVSRRGHHAIGAKPPRDVGGPIHRLPVVYGVYLTKRDSLRALFRNRCG